MKKLLFAGLVVCLAACKDPGNSLSEQQIPVKSDDTSAQQNEQFHQSASLTQDLTGNFSVIEKDRNPLYIKIGGDRTISGSKIYKNISFIRYETDEYILLSGTKDNMAVADTFECIPDDSLYHFYQVKNNGTGELARDGKSFILKKIN